MKNPFKRAGFDSLISKGTTIEGSLVLQSGETTILDGTMRGTSISQASADKSSTLVINGQAEALQEVRVTNVTITGTLTCETLEVSGVLAVKNGANVQATSIRYGSLVVEPSANLNGTMSRIGPGMVKTNE